MDTDIVIFRKFPDGDVIALLPYLPAECLTAWPCQSYMHIGQHGAADPRIVDDTRPARASMRRSRRSWSGSATAWLSAGGSRPTPTPAARRRWRRSSRRPGTADDRRFRLPAA
jgi:hypothetical protein